MDIEKMKFEALNRQVQGVLEKVGACLQIVSSILRAANDDTIPIDLEQLKAANAERYATAVQEARDAISELAKEWPE